MGSLFKRTLRVSVLVLLAIIMIITILLPAGMMASAEEESGGMNDLSMYNRASEVARNFGTVLAPGSGDVGMIEGADGQSIPAGNAGGMLGYADIMSDDSGVSGWIISSYTASSATITYEQLRGIIPEQFDSDTIFAGSDNPFFHYAGYGEALNEMGLSKAVQENGIGHTGRLFATGFMLIVYLGANAAPFLFNIALTLLSWLNPFKMFMGVIEGTGNMELGILSTVADYIGEIYELVQDFSIYFLFPLLLVLTVLSVLLFTRTSAMKKFARYGVRLFMLFAGLPLIGATYTGVVEDLNEEMAAGSTYADYLVLSSYVDFENWARETRLAPPEDGVIVNPRNATASQTDDMRIPDRDMILEINATRAGNDMAGDLREAYADNGGLGDIIDSGSASDGQESLRTSAGVFDFYDTFDLLLRHMNTGTYSGSSYDGEMSGQIQSMRSTYAGLDDADEEGTLSAAQELDANIIKMFSLSSDDNRTWSQQLFGQEDFDWQKPIDWNDSSGLFTHAGSSDDIFQFGNFNYNIYNSGGLTVTSTGAFEMDPVIEDAHEADGPIAPIGAENNAVGGLSPLALYNFLNTTFDDAGMTIYSPEQTATMSSRDAYASVAFASSGVSAFMRYMENVVVMLALATLAVAYGIMMIGAAVKNVPRILTSVFGTALGSIAFTAKLLISVAVMIIQILGMVLFYFLSENIIMSMLVNFNSLTIGIEDWIGSSSVLAEFIRSFLVIVVTVGVSWFMIKNVNVFREMLEEVVSNAINRLMGLLDTSTGGQGLDTAQTTGGRIGSDGKLTEGARAADDKNSLFGGARRIMGDAHDIESRREQLAQEGNKTGAGGEGGNPERSFAQKMRARAATARDLAGAKGKDIAKSPFSEGKSYEREMDAKNRKIDSMPYGRGKDPLSIKDEDKETSKKEKALTNTSGQKIDAHGNIARDENGNALNSAGEPISAEAGLATSGLFGRNLETDENGAILNSEGDIYTDENGNAFYADEHGRLINEDGDFAALDKDGTLQPVESIPGHDGKPVMASDEAKLLDSMRKDTDAYQEMKARQNGSHYGMDDSGQAVDADGNALQYRDSEGNLQNVQMDEDGYLTDATGERLAAGDIVGDMDNRGFETAIDPDTGDALVQHKGDAAMKPLYAASESGSQADEHIDGLTYTDADGNEQPVSTDAAGYITDDAGNRLSASDINGDMAGRGFESAKDADGKDGLQHKSAKKDVDGNETKDLQTLAKQAAKANSLADAAEARVDALRAEGAPPYAINQAERYAKQTRSDATKKEDALNKAMASNATGKNGARSKQQKVTPEQMDAARKHQASAEQNLKSEQNKLDNLKADGASPQAIARQERKVDARKAAVGAAGDMVKDMETASETGRPVSEISEARARTERAEDVLESATAAYEQAVDSGASSATIAQKAAAVDKASGVLEDAYRHQSNMSKPPKGTDAEIDAATAKHTEAEAKHAQATRDVNRLEEAARPMTQKEVERTRAEKQAAQDQMAATRKGASRHKEATAAYDAAKAKVSSAARTVGVLQRRGAPESEIQAAKKNYNTASQQAAAASARVEKHAPAAKAYNEAARTNRAADKKLKQTGRPLSPATMRTVKAEQQAASAEMAKHEAGNKSYSRASSVKKQAKRAVNQTARDVEKLKRSGAPASEVNAAAAKHETATARLKEATRIHDSHKPSAEKYSAAKRTYDKATRRLDAASPSVSNRELSEARAREREAGNNVTRAAREKHALIQPKDARVKTRNPSADARGMQVPKTTSQESFKTLAAAGVTNYADYSNKVKHYSKAVAEGESRLKQAEQRYRSLKQSKRPAQIVNQASAQVEALREDVAKNRKQHNMLKDNAHGFLKEGGFQPPGAKRPIRMSGAVVSREMDNLAHMKRMSDKLDAKAASGVLTARDAKRRRSLKSRLKKQRESLASMGFDESALESSSDIRNIRQHVKQSWSNFVSGEKSAAGGEIPKGTGSSDVKPKDAATAANGNKAQSSDGPKSQPRNAGESRRYNTRDRK